MRFVWPFNRHWPGPRWGEGVILSDSAQKTRRVGRGCRKLKRMPRQLEGGRPQSNTWASGGCGLLWGGRVVNKSMIFLIFLLEATEGWVEKRRRKGRTDLHSYNGGRAKKRQERVTAIEGITLAMAPRAHTDREANREASNQTNGQTDKQATGKKHRRAQRHGRARTQHRRATLIHRHVTECPVMTARAVTKTSNTQGVPNSW